MIGHRGQGFKDLYAKIQPQLQALLYTQAAGLPEHLLRLGRDGRRHPQPGGQKGAQLHVRRLFRQVARCLASAAARTPKACRCPGVRPSAPRTIDAKLATGQFDALTLIHNETSTGVMSPLAEIAALKKKYPDVMFIVDSVSSMTAVPIQV